MNRSAHPFGERRRRVKRSDLAATSARLPDAAYPIVQPWSANAGSITTSVLVSTFNDEPFVEECIESLLVQSVIPSEIFVYDNGSSDGTLAKLRSYGSRLTIIEKPAAQMSSERQVTSGLEQAIERSTGQLVFLLSGHDRFKREKLEHFVSVFTTNADAAMIQAPMDKIDEHGRVVGHNIDRRKHVVEHLKEIQRRQDVDFFYPASALAFSRQYLKSLLPVDASDGIAVPLEMRIALVAPHFGRVITLPATLGEWRRPNRHRMAKNRYPRRLHVEQTWLRAKLFNHFCRRHGLRPISPWRNARFYLQLIRFILPDVAYRLLKPKFRPTFLSPGGSHHRE